jgi:hypothetical protein
MASTIPRHGILRLQCWQFLWQAAMGTKTSLIQRLAWLYALGFFTVVAIGHIPGLTDEGGYLFGFYSVTLVIDAGHFLAGLLAAIAAWHSTRWSVFYFRFIAIPFGLDALISLFFSRDLTETGSIFYGIGPPNFTLHNILANSPHILLSVVALWIGYGLSRSAAPAR